MINQLAGQPFVCDLQQCTEFAALSSYLEESGSGHNSKAEEKHKLFSQSQADQSPQQSGKDLREGLIDQTYKIRHFFR